MSDLIQTLISGLSVGLVIGGLALALAVGFQGSGVLNFAQGQIATLSAYLAWQFTQWGFDFWAALLMATAISFVLGVVIQRTMIAPVMGREELSILIVTVAIFLLIDSLIGTVWGYLPKNLDAPSDGVVRVEDVVLTHQALVQMVVLLLAVVLVSALFRFTRIGLQMRAAASAPESSALSGVNLASVLAVGWGVAAAIGALTGTVSAPVTGLSPDINTSTLLFAFAAAALGGFHSRLGAFAGGLIVGLVTTLSGRYVDAIGNDLRLLVPLVVIVLALLIAPDGIFSSQRKERV